MADNELQKENVRLQSELSEALGSLREIVEESKYTEKQLEIALRDKKLLEQRLSQISVDNSDDTEELKRELVVAQDRSKSLLGDYNFLLRSMNHYNELFKREIDSKNLQIEKLTEDNKMLESRVLSQDVKMQQYELEIQNLKGLVSQSQTETEKSNTEIRHLEATLEEREELLNNHKKKLLLSHKDLINKRAVYEEEIEKWKQSSNSLQKELLDISTRYEELQKDYHQLSLHYEHRMLENPVDTLSVTTLQLQNENKVLLNLLLKLKELVLQQDDENIADEQVPKLVEYTNNTNLEVEHLLGLIKIKEDNFLITEVQKIIRMKKILLHKIKYSEKLAVELQSEKNKTCSLEMKLQEIETQSEALKTMSPSETLKELNKNLQSQNESLINEIAQLKVEIAEHKSVITTLSSQMKEEKWKAQEGTQQQQLIPDVHKAMKEYTNLVVRSTQQIQDKDTIIKKLMEKSLPDTPI